MFVVFYSIGPWVIFCLLFNLHSVYGPYTDRKVPLRSVQTVRIVKPCKPLSEIRRENILSVLNEMQFTDRIWTAKCLYDLYRPYGSSKRSPVAQVMRCNCQTVYGPKIVFTIRTDRKAVFFRPYQFIKPYGSQGCVFRPYQFVYIQSRTQSPQAFWSAGRRQERLWDNGKISFF